MFTGSGDGTSWSDGSNWSCGSEPNPSSDDIVIPPGFNVINDGKDDFSFDSGNSLTIDGSLDMQNKKIEINNSSSYLTIGPMGSLSNINELFFNSGGGGSFLHGASIEIEHIKVDDNSQLVIIACCIQNNSKLEVLSSGRITGTGCIDYSGSSGNFINNGNGTFGCTSSSLSGCTLNGGCTPLPVSLISFTAEVSNRIVELSWVTASETMNDRFEVFRSSNGENWELAVTVMGSGNSNAILNYSTIDELPLAGTRYYKLVQIDYDGTRTDYSIISVSNSSLDEFEQLPVPNPTNKYITLFGENQTDISIQNLSGQQISSSKVIIDSLKDKVTVDVSMLSPGVYFIRSSDKIYRFVKM